MRYRPWGPLDWILSLSSRKNWHFVGVLGTEERSLCSWKYLKGLGLLAGQHVMEIQDVESEKYRERTEQALNERREELVRAGDDPDAIPQMGLMSEMFEILSFVS